jgi:dipeptidyl aminopeptidase/acylaminoacyl peptidase
VSRPTPFERRLHDELHAARPPRSAEAERRAWHVVSAAHAERTPPPRRRRAARVAVAAAAALALGAVALTPAGAKVGDWIDDVVSATPGATRSTLDSLPANGRLLVMADSGAWVVRDDGSTRRLGAFRDATWSPGGLFVAGARGRELVAIDPDGEGERWTRPAPGPVSLPRWSPDGYRIAYRSGSDQYVAIGDNEDSWRLWRGVGAAPPAWKPVPEPLEQVLAFEAGGRVRIVEVDAPHRVLGSTPPGPPPREIWWADDGRRLVTVTARSVNVHGPRGALLRTIELPRGFVSAGSAMAPAGKRLAVVASSARTGEPSRLLLIRLDREAPLRMLVSLPGSFEGLTWSMDGSVLVLGLPEADQWLFVRPRAAVGPQSVRGIRDEFAGSVEPRRGSFPRPAGWCYAEPVDRTESGQLPCSSGSAP